MGFWSNLFKSGASEPINAVTNLIDAVVTTDAERAQADLLKQRLMQQPALVQAEITKVQAMHRSTFVAGARPFMMWVCGFGFAIAFVINPLLQWLFPDVGTPTLPLDVMLELSLTMLGMSALRSFEKHKGLAK
jgi:hypothetical protein